MTTQGLGHRGVVRAPYIVRDVVAFVVGQGLPRFSDEASRLEYELFHPDARWTYAKS
jgi:hypothetical protein